MCRVSEILVKCFKQILIFLSLPVYNNLIPSLNSENRQSELMANNSDNSRERKELWDWGIGMNLGMEFLSVAAGVTAKDKRLKEVKNKANSLKTKDLFSVFSKFEFSIKFRFFLFLIIIFYFRIETRRNEKSDKSA